MPESCIELSVSSLVRDVSQEKVGVVLEGNKETRMWHHNIVRRFIKSPETELVEVKYFLEIIEGPIIAPSSIGI